VAIMFFAILIMSLGALAGWALVEFSKMISECDRDDYE